MKSQKGNIAIIISVVIVILVAVGTYAIFHKSSKTTSTTQPRSANSSSTNSQASSGTIVQTKTDAKVGQYLADANGNALYTYGEDRSGVSNCSGSCLYSWPVYQATGSTTSLPANVTAIKRSDGSPQYAYKGMPLYTFSSDSSGQVTGDGVSNFHIAKP